MYIDKHIAGSYISDDIIEKQAIRTLKMTNGKPQAG